MCGCRLLGFWVGGLIGNRRLGFCGLRVVLDCYAFWVRWFVGDGLTLRFGVDLKVSLTWSLACVCAVGVGRPIWFTCFVSLGRWFWCLFVLKAFWVFS